MDDGINPLDTLVMTYPNPGGSATYSGLHNTGYYTLVTQLQDGGYTVMGAVEVVRIVDGEISTGVYNFLNINQPIGTILVNIETDMKNPVGVTLTGTAATVVVENAMVVDATNDYGAVTYVWYVNGSTVATGSNHDVSSALDVGFYRLDVTAFSTDGKTAGSASFEFEVTL